DREIEAAPEEVDRAALADEPRPEDLEDPIHLDQRMPEAARRVRVVCRMPLVLLERGGIRDLVRHGPDANRHAELPERLHDTGVELRDRSGTQRERAHPAGGGLDQQPMGDEVERDGEARRAVRDGAGRQPAGRDVEGHVPRAVGPRGLGPADLAHHVRPEMQRGAGVAPGVEGQRRPRRRVGGTWWWRRALDSLAHEHREYPARVDATSPPGHLGRCVLCLIDKRSFGLLRQPSLMLAHLGLLQERIASLVPEREALVWGDPILTHAELAARSRRIANAVRALGLGCRMERNRLEPWESGQDHVALYLYNGPEWVESMYGVLKARAAFVNVNYRYKAEELRYVLENGEARAIVYHAAFAPTLAAVRDQLPALRHLIQVRDDSNEPLLPGAIDYEPWVAGASDALPDLPYSADDLYVLFTGGTTGLPKGVLWRHEDVFYNGLGGHLPGFNRLETEEQLRDHVNLGIGGRSLVCLPFMHGAGQWNVFNSFHRGGTVVLPD